MARQRMGRDVHDRARQPPPRVRPGGRRDDADAVLRLFRATGMFWLMAGAIDEGQRWGEAAVAAARRLGDPARLMQPLLALSEYPRFSGEPDRALALKAEALGMARAAGDHARSP